MARRRRELSPLSQGTEEETKAGGSPGAYLTLTAGKAQCRLATASAPHTGPHPAGHLPKLGPSPGDSPRRWVQVSPPPEETEAVRPSDWPTVSQLSSAGEHSKPGLDPGSAGLWKPQRPHARHFVESLAGLPRPGETVGSHITGFSAPVREPGKLQPKNT